MSSAAPNDLSAALRTHFGFSSFRPLQEEIVRATLAGQDVFALLPTGGGKSLCYQLPALLLPGLTVVVSPLIALMKDQVDALQANGISATFLNSTLDGTDVRLRVGDLHAGRCKLLYLAPERLMLPDFLERLATWDVRLFAVDEAHCISEWGHDFRPEYRQLSQLRSRFPDVPLAVFTATATQRVRTDIVTQLALRDPRCFVASFNRPNLIYRVLPKQDPDAQLLEIVRRRGGDSGIVYCQARKTTEEVAQALRKKGIQARAYHAGLAAEERAATQEAFKRDDVQVVCATIAFGMGVDKPNVRFVVHYDLPRNLESYYQETGRAGRDGLPAECVLLFSGGDIAKQMFFIDQKSEHEAEIARKQLWKMIEYAESFGCRRIPLLKYFGETYGEPNCQACDGCLGTREEFDGTLPAQKFMSCVYRIKKASPQFGPGLRYVADVLRGERSDVIERWKHETLTTYGIGREFSRKEWLFIGRELLRLQLLRETHDGKYARVELTERGLQVLTARQAVMLSRIKADEDRAPESATEIATPKTTRKRAKVRPERGEIECDEVLFERLRALRRKLADERDLPAYIIFSDATLREMARDCPETDAEFLEVSGVGERKRQEFAGPFLAEITTYLSENPPQSAGEKPAPGYGLSAAARETVRQFDAHMSVPQIALERRISETRVWEHLHEASVTGEKIDLGRFLSSEQRIEILGAFLEREAENGGGDPLADVHDRLGERYPYGLLKLFRTQSRLA